MDGNEFERRVRRAGKANGVSVTWKSHGKGSHGRLYYGARFATLKDRRKEIGGGLVNAMLKQLGLTKKDVGL